MDITYGSDTLETGVTVMHRAADYGQKGRKQVTVMEFSVPTDIKGSPSSESTGGKTVDTPENSPALKTSFPVTGIAIAAAGLYLLTKGA